MQEDCQGFPNQWRHFNGPTPPLDANRLLVFQRISAYSRDALKVSHFSGTNPVPGEGVLESGVFWEGQLIYRDWNCPVLLPLNMASQRSLTLNYFLLLCDSLSSTQWERNSLLTDRPAIPVLGTTVQLSLVCTQEGAEVFDQWHFSSQLVPWCLSV